VEKQAKIFYTVNMLRSSKIDVPPFSLYYFVLAGHYFVGELHQVMAVLRTC